MRFFSPRLINVFFDLCNFFQFNIFCCIQSSSYHTLEWHSATFESPHIIFSFRFLSRCFQRDILFWKLSYFLDILICNRKNERAKKLNSITFSWPTVTVPNSKNFPGQEKGFLKSLDLHMPLRVLSLFTLWRYIRLINLISGCFLLFCFRIVVLNVWWETWGYSVSLRELMTFWGYSCL